MFLKKLIAVSRWGKLNGVQLKTLEGMTLREVFTAASLKATYKNYKHPVYLRRRYFR